MCYDRAALHQALLVTVYLNTQLAKLALFSFCIQSVRKRYTCRSRRASRYCWLQPKNRKQAVNTRADAVVNIYALSLRIQGHLSGSDRCACGRVDGGSVDGVNDLSRIFNLNSSGVRSCFVFRMIPFGSGLGEVVSL